LRERRDDRLKPWFGRLVKPLPVLVVLAVGTEEPELKGYRVRLRVVEEHDVALLAESSEDAKARAEADIRGGGEFEAIQDSWLEEIVSVEAVAVEQDPDLE
jgi:hypothetical protein